MFRSLFKAWAITNVENLISRKVSTEFVIRKDIDVEKLLDPSTVIRHESENCVGQVIVWESGQLEYQVVHIQTEEQLLWNYIEKLSENPNFDEITTEYFKVLISGLKN